MLGRLQERFAKNWVKLRAWEMTDFDSIVMLVCWLASGWLLVDLLMPCSLVLGRAFRATLHCCAEHGQPSPAQPLPGSQIETWQPHLPAASDPALPSLLTP